MKARIPQHREFIINFPDTVDNAKANEGWAKSRASGQLAGALCSLFYSRYCGKFHEPRSTRWISTTLTFSLTW